ncbi:hypothetical protein WJX75_006688 [Coccomyxa subellipsoidea]|uniref:U6 snRNA phosphodiesterase 1 n=1 Tax=Coccomyxa subellipsoidea TaxID=248742 RepID=A0ABR2YVZ1_9CHLO
MADSSPVKRSKIKPATIEEPGKAVPGVERVRGTNAELPSAFTLLAGFVGGSVPLSTDEYGEPEQDPHLGRIRTFEHVEGNYATHVHITVNVPQRCAASLEATLQQCKRSIPGLHPMMDTSLPKARSLAPLVQALYHLSLSRVVAIRYPQIEPLIASLRKHLAKRQRFKVSFQQLEAFENEDSTRSFLSILVDEGFEQVCRAIRCTDRAFAKRQRVYAVWEAAGS